MWRHYAMSRDTTTRYPVGLLLVLVTWQLAAAGTWAASTCGLPKSRSNYMVRATVNPLIAQQLSTVNVPDYIHCQLACLADETCAYVTLVKATGQCTLYCLGTTSYDVTGMDVHEVEMKEVDVSDVTTL